MIQWDDAVVSAIARRRSVIMLGSGISRNSTNATGKRPATWVGFLNEACAQAGNPSTVLDLIQQRDYLTACEVIKNRLGNDVFVRLVQAEYQKPGYEAAEIHKYIYELDSSIVASPNFDLIYDTYASNASRGTIIKRDHTSNDLLNFVSGGDTRLLLKTHGNADAAHNLIFTRKDYAEARTRYRLFYDLLKSLVLTHTFIFLGCGVDDPDIRALFEDVQYAYGLMPAHYMTLPDGEVSNDILRVASEAMKIKFLTYSPENGHAELTESLLELVSLVQGRRDQLSKEQTW
ncbi:SIR2-like domain-containing protein [Azotobacter beijerinckii]|uniref:SIR2-like domain-containing protein n=1 Tax=Azotobacter beijerinckii TaxID=170623 RepID=A0A1H6QUT2_9GAMM|nr:SIR2 family protein [Azotobacter beijerinckii]SEI43957.1 SIR2-like domain-containing protein [Azotobacter beijerinckii]